MNKFDILLNRWNSEMPVSGNCDNELATIENFLQSKLNRGTPPSTHDLGEYALGLLSPEKAAVVEQYLNDFPQRNYDLNQLRAYLNSLESELPIETVTKEDLRPTINQRINVTLARLVPDLFNASAPAYRSQGDDEKPRLYEADDTHISIDVLNDSERSDQRCLLGLMIGPETEGFTAHVWRSEPPVCVDSADVTDAGNFVVSGLDPDQYDLILEGPNLEMIVVEELHVGL